MLYFYVHSTFLHGHLKKVQVGMIHLKTLIILSCNYVIVTYNHIVFQNINVVVTAVIFFREKLYNIYLYVHI